MDNQHRRIAGYRDLDETSLRIIDGQKAIEKLLAEHCDALACLADSASRARWAALARTHLEIGMMFAMKTVAAPTLSIGCARAEAVLAGPEPAR